MVVTNVANARPTYTADMAFTLAHPAAVIPLRKLPGLALLPLVVGAVIPDLIPLLPFGIEWHLPNTHSWAGSLQVDLPAGLLVLIMIYLLRHALVQPLWHPHRAIAMHAINDYFATRYCWLMAAPSVLIGSWTHLLWDRLTHESHWTSRNLPMLNQPLFPEATHELPLYHFLQYMTSAIGLLILGWQYWLAVRKQHGETVDMLPLRNSRLHLFVTLLVIALMLGILRLWHQGISQGSIYLHLSLVLKTALACFGLLYVASGLWIQRRNTNQPIHAPPEISP